MLFLEKELEKSKQFLLKKDINDLLVLSTENVALVEAMISIDSDYCRAADKNAGPEKDSYIDDAYQFWITKTKADLKEYNGKYKGSTAYWITQLEEALQKNLHEVELKKYILMSVLAVDRDNSTHISSDSVGPKFLTECIYNWLLNHKIEELKDRQIGIEFIAELTKKTFSTPIRIGKKIYIGRENYSFATKFCHYVCFFLFQGDDRDIYSIYDGVVAKILPYYLKRHEIFKKDGEPYEKCDFDKANEYELYSKLIDHLRGGKISRNGFDHLLWYYHKGRPLPKTNK